MWYNSLDMAFYYIKFIAHTYDIKILSSVGDLLYIKKDSWKVGWKVDCDHSQRKKIITM